MQRFLFDNELHPYAASKICDMCKLDTRIDEIKPNKTPEARNLKVVLIELGECSGKIALSS